MASPSSEEDASKGFPERLKRLIAERNHSHRGLAKALGVSQQSVTNWTQGHNEPSLRHLREIARVLDLPLGALLEEARDPNLAGATALDLLRELTAQPVGPTVRSLVTAAPDLSDLFGRAEQCLKAVDRQNALDRTQAPRSSVDASADG